MQPLWLLLALCCQHTADASAASVQDRLRLSRHAYSFTDLAPDNGVLPASATVQAHPDISECECRARCLADFACRGYGYSDPIMTCLLTEDLPRDERKEGRTDDCEDWRWHVRTGVRQLGEPCAADSDCSLLVPGATCSGSICVCHFLLEEDEAGGCRKAGGFIAVGMGKLMSGLQSEISAASIEDCKTVCAGNLSCVAFDFAAADGRCSLYSEGITNDIDSGRDVQSFVWRFARADGTPPDSYQKVNGNYLRFLPAVDGVGAATACFADSAILFPGVSQEELAPLSDFIASQATSEYIWVGFEDMLEEGRYVTSDGGVASNIAWDVNKPNGRDYTDCGVIRSLSGLIHDGGCSNDFKPLCQYVGENLALGRHSWMNAFSPTFPAAYGNDGNVANHVHTPENGLPFPTPTWTVDLGGPVQVSSVLYVARTTCCGERNRFTEIRVGSHPATFDDQHSARCVLLEEQFVDQGYARLFRCTLPLTGRYVRLIRDKQEPTVDFAELAVFGNRLQAQ